MLKSLFDELLWRVIIFVAVILGTVLFFGFSEIDWRSQKEKETQRQVDIIADRLDQEIVKGMYEETPDLADKDSWGASLRVRYEQEGVGQRLEVRSSGKDGQFDTNDDLLASRWLLNATGIGKAASSYAGDVAKEAAKGAADGVKESVKDSLKERFGGLLKKKKEAESSKSIQSSEN